MATSGPTVSSGRRGYLRYQYGDHFWVPEIHADFSRGMVRDTARVAIPAGAVYDSADFLLHQPGVAQKRGGTSYSGPAMTAATYATGAAYALFASGLQLLAVGDNGHLYTVTSGTTTDVATLGATFASRHRPVIVPSAAAILAVFFSGDGTTAPKKWSGAAAANLGGSPPTGIMGAVYKQRLLIANSAANPNRLWFSNVPDVETTWDTTNSWIDFEQDISGLAALQNTLLVFHRGSTERIIGATPPPQSDMDRALLWQIGTPDARSIRVQDGNCIFASPRGVYITNGGTPQSLTEQGGIDTYWQGLFGSYDPTTWTISCGISRQFLFVTVLDNTAALTAGLMCYLPRRSWWRVTNMRSMMYASGIESNDELVYADRSTNRLVSLSGIFTPASGNKNDANGTAVTPTLELAPVGQGPGVKSYGFGRVDYDMRDAASDNPTMAITFKTGIEADTSVTPAESPLTESTTLSRNRFSICRDAQACTIALAQTNASSKTEIYAVEVEQRPQSMVGDGVS